MRPERGREQAGVCCRFIGTSHNKSSMQQKCVLAPMREAVKGRNGFGLRLGGAGDAER